MTGIERWLESARVKSHLTVREIDLADCRKWQLSSGRLVHETGRFFSIAGVEQRPAEAGGDGSLQAMIDQPEVGWLGFVVRDAGEGVEWLLQAKTEPGSIRGTQIAPSLQATRSNYMQEHGGQPTRFLDLFRAGDAVISDAPHSEQGSAFLWKFNRNTTLALPKDREIDLRDHRWVWCDGPSLRDCLARSYTVNTDARSVIATSPWPLLAGGGPLFRAQPLARSYRVRLENLIARLLERRAIPRSPRISWSFVPLDAMPGWTLHPGGLRDPDDREVVEYREVTTTDREVSTWCQPFLSQARSGLDTLIMRIVDGIAEVFVSLVQELGFGNRREFGPSIQTSAGIPGYLDRLLRSPNSIELVRIDQSDEGGRFMSVRGQYRIVLTRDDGDPRKQYPFGSWIPLGSLEMLVHEPGSTTNELRTLVSLLLSNKLDSALAAL